MCKDSVGSSFRDGKGHLVLRDMERSFRDDKGHLVFRGRERSSFRDYKGCRLGSV